MKAKKSLGQNFLNNDKIISDIVNLIKPGEEDLIIEIGPGRGALTRYLSKLHCKLVCVEIDKDMKPYLSKYESDKVTIIYEDILKTDFSKMLSKFKFNRLFIIGNLPYYITSPILEYIIQSKISPDEMVFMVQDEVADRFSACPGNRDFGYMTLFLDYYYTVSKEIYVNRNNFSPIPNVDSAVIKMLRKDNVYILDEKKYFDFLKQAFKMKRKTLKNNLSTKIWPIVSSVLQKNRLTDSVRAEEIPQEVFIEIFNKITKED